MALVLNDRVKETTTSTGTGTVNLAGAETGFETFVAGIGNTNTTYYAIVHQSADEFEVGLGTVSDSSPDTLSRTTIISSSNSDSAVNFSAGTKDVFCTLPASKSLFADASGNVGIGETSPDLKLHVKSSGQIAKLETTASTGDCILTFADASANKGFVGFGSSSSEIFQITNIENGDMKFDTNNTERMRIDSSGNVGIGASSPNHALSVGSTSVATSIISVVGSSSGFPQVRFSDDTNESGQGRIFYDSANDALGFSSAGSERMRINSSGNVGIGNTSPSVALGVTGAIIASDNITAYGTPSDIRLKENIKVIDNALDKVKQLKGITYDLKSDGNRLTGLIAQDVEKVLPEAVYETSAVDDADDKHLAIRYGNTVGLLVEAIKEQQEQIQTLTAKVKELEDK